jgi:SAM-dependent methyltransferase
MGSAVLAMADSVRLPLRDGAADAVLSLGVLCCMEDASLGAAVAEVARVLRPGGWLLLGVPRRRGRSDERRVEEAGLVKRGGERPGIAIFQKRDKGEPP